MSSCTEWIEDLLGAAIQENNLDSICMIECCGKGCAARKGAEEDMIRLKTASSNCTTRADYVTFLNDVLSITIDEAEDGIILHLGKEKCSCPMATELSKNTDMLCECTRGHEIAVWSTFFGKPVNVVIEESLLRGGNDCVLKILV